MLKGYIHVSENEAVFADYVEVVEKKDIVQPYDEYIGDIVDDSYNHYDLKNAFIVFKSVDGNYIAHKDYDIY